MKRTAFFLSLFISGSNLWSQTKIQDTTELTPVEVQATRASAKAPFTKTNLDKAAIAKQNLGQDLPFLLNQTPSTVVSSDAGNGIGYTGLRIRGTDLTRINVTLNGIPYNDAESQSVYFVDLPDFASSVSSLQIQRGVGTSSNGAGAFGATINLSTNEIIRTPYAEVLNSFGTFNTRRHTIKAGTGLLNDHFTIDARLSKISSDGFIDRAFSDLQSYYLSAAWLNARSSIRLNVFSGKEKTFQAWNGVPEHKLFYNADSLALHYTNNEGSLYFTDADRENLFNSNSRRYNWYLYDNQTDNYKQDHYQLFFNHAFSSKLVLSTALFLTQGKGYY
jgi:iron complex outermembrane receptor protein